MLLATNVATVGEQVQVPAALSWIPRKCSTRHEATASVGDQELPPSVAATSVSRFGTASFCVSALASSCATRERFGEPANTLYSSPLAPKVHPVPDPEIGPQWAAVSPVLQLQFEPGSMPAASTWATNVATGGATAMGGATAIGCTSTGTATGTADGEGAAGVETGAIVGVGTDVEGVVVAPRTAPVMWRGVVHARSGPDDGLDGERWRLNATIAVIARVTASETATKRRRRREGGPGGALSTMC
jgi:hypothetical protein